MDFKDLTEEQKAKAKACKSPEELLELAKAEGIDLTDEQLESVSGGWDGCENKVCDPFDPCPDAYI